jgi:phytanoyl-CoA hydroxylase
MRIVGSVDRCDERLIEGWLTIADEPATKLALEFVLDGRVIGHAVADQLREDLKEAGLGGGCCAFSFATPTFVPKSQVDHIEVRLLDSTVVLPTPRRAKTTQAQPLRETVSQFGGLWIDRHDWLDRLALKHRSGELSDALSAAIFRFVRDGYLVIESAVEPDLIERLNAEIDEVWVSPPPGMLMETFEPEGRMRYVPPDQTYRSGRTKLLDLYAFSPLTRQAIASPKVVEFLAAIFEDRPKAFQGLMFHVGSQQAIHKDTAYVKIDSNPMHLAATWLALEDIEAGTGELEYFVGSHRAADFLFGGTSKWMENHTADHERFLHSLHEDAEAHGHVRGSFLAKRGDVLIWHADLAHGGSSVTQPGRLRKSLVTHFTAEGDDPFYLRNAQHRRADEHGCGFISQYGDISN